MILARVTGTLVATQKNHKLEGAKLLLVQPLTLEDTPRGPELIAVDGVGAGVHEKVLIVLEGRAASDAIDKKPHRLTRRLSASSIRWICHDHERTGRARARS